MRVIFLTNFYPPASCGGYEQWCQEVAEQMRGHGHDVVILTSRHRREDITGVEPAWIHRDLHFEMGIGLPLRNGLEFFTNRKVREQENLSRLHKLIKDFTPDAILVWGMWNLHRSLAALAEDLMPGRVVYYMGDYWPTLPSQFQFYWEAPAQSWQSAVPKRLLGGIALKMLAREQQLNLDFGHVLFPTAFMQRELKRMGMASKQSKIIYGAIDTSLYEFRHVNGQNDTTLRLLYVGRLIHDKGVHTAIEALGQLVHQHGLKNAQLNIVGSGDGDYETYLRDLVQQQSLEPFVTFSGSMPKEELPNLYQQADIFLFTSIWQEPFGRVIIEAMASGLVVVGSAVGGAAEILKHEKTGLVFSPGDANSLAKQIFRLAESPQLQRDLAFNARQFALENYDMKRMTTEIESYLQEIQKIDVSIST